MTNFIETQKELAMKEYFHSKLVPSAYIPDLVEAVIQNTLEEVENNRDDDSCECDNCHRWRRIRKSLLAEMVIKKEV